jgi:hypothetical protein
MSSNPGITVESVRLSALRAQGRSPKTLITYEHAVRQLREWRESDRDLANLTRIEALAFVRHLGERFQPGGVAARVRSLRAMHDSAWDPRRLRTLEVRMEHGISPVAEAVSG